jgi:predicted Zn-dependent protease
VRPAEYSHQVQKWIWEATEANNRRDGATAERLFKECIQSAGESPDLLNNLAAAYDAQARREEASELSRRIHERWPDYFFGRIAMANMAAMKGECDRAEVYLAPLRRRRRLHVTEFRGLATAYIQLAEARGNFEAVDSWIGVWKRFAPDDPHLRHCIERRQSNELLRLFSKVARRFKGR